MAFLLDRLLDKFRRPKKYKARSDSKKKREKLMDRTVAIAIATDAEVEREWIETKYGICVAEVDPIAKVAEELRKKWSKQTLQILGEDEESQESAIRALVNEIKKNNALSEKLHDEVDKDFVTTREDVESNPIVRRRRLRRKKIEQLGDSAQNNGPAAEDNANAETSVLSELAKRLSSADTGAGSGRIIAVEVNGTLIEMGPEAYEIFKKQRQELRALRSRSKDLPQQAPDVELPPSKANPADAGV